MVTRFADGRANLRLSRTNAAILAGEEDLTDWDDEEIERGQRRNKAGTWPNRRPLVVAQEVHDERIRRTMKSAHNLLRESTYVAVVLLRAVVEDEDASYNYRLQAAGMILERTLPKNQNYNLTIGIDAEPLFMKILRNSVVGIVPGELGTGDDSDILDAEIVGESEIVWER